MLNPEPAVVVDDLVMKYGEKTAVDHLSFTVPRGTITAVLGPNGAGKTTTLETCEGYRRPHGGSVRVLGLDPHHDRGELIPRLGVQLQGGGAWSGVRATEMLSHMASLHANPLDVDLLAERLGLHECGKTPFRRLSGGQQQRLGLAMAVVGRPELVFVDEPTAGMDPAIRRETWALLEELRSSGVTVVLTTHYLDEAEHLSDLVHIVDAGRLVRSGSVAELTGSGLATGSVTTTGTLSATAVQEFETMIGPATLAPERHSLAFTASASAELLATVSTWCVRNGLEVASFSLGQQTLEDVYLEATRRTEDAR